jgi:hypothetical protein
VKAWLVAGLLAAAPALARADASHWALEASTLTYVASHTLHGSRGTTHQARGKGVCDGSGCRFLAAAPVNSFESGDANRDLHMVEAARGAKFPMVAVNTSLPKIPEGPDFAADLDVEFAGEKIHYAAVPFHVQEKGADFIRFTGAVPLTLSDAKIPPPSLLGIAMKNDVPVNVEMTWRRE